MRCASVLMLFVLFGLVAMVGAQQARPQVDAHGDSLPDRAIARLGTMRFQIQDANVNTGRRGWWYRSAVALAPDGTTLAAATSHEKGTRIEFLDTSTGKVMRKLELPVIGGNRTQYTPDGQNLVFDDWSGIQLMSVQTGNVTTKDHEDCDRTLSGFCDRSFA